MKDCYSILRTKIKSVTNCTFAPGHVHVQQGLDHFLSDKARISSSPTNSGEQAQYLFHSAVVCEHRCLGKRAESQNAYGLQVARRNLDRNVVQAETRLFCRGPGSVVIRPRMSTSAPTCRSQTVTACCDFSETASGQLASLMNRSQAIALHDCQRWRSRVCEPPQCGLHKPQGRGRDCYPHRAACGGCESLQPRIKTALAVNR